jgi:hypothetical protein
LCVFPVEQWPCSCPPTACSLNAGAPPPACPAHQPHNATCTPRVLLASSCALLPRVRLRPSLQATPGRAKVRAAWPRQGLARSAWRHSGCACLLPLEPPRAHPRLSSRVTHHRLPPRARCCSPPPPPGCARCCRCCWVCVRPAGCRHLGQECRDDAQCCPSQQPHEPNDPPAQPRVCDSNGPRECHARAAARSAWQAACAREGCWRVPQSAAAGAALWRAACWPQHKQPACAAPAAASQAVSA